MSEVIFRKNWASQELNFEVRCESAADMYSLKSKMHTHSEYDTEYSHVLNKWEKMGFRYCTQEDFVGRTGVIQLKTKR